MLLILCVVTSCLIFFSVLYFNDLRMHIKTQKAVTGMWSFTLNFMTPKTGFFFTKEHTEYGYSAIKTVEDSFSQTKTQPKEKTEFHDEL